MKPGYDSRPSVPAAIPNNDAVRLRMFEMTCSKCEHTERRKETRSSLELGMAAVMAGVASYLVVVLYAGSDDGVDGELALLVERRRSHCGSFGVGRRPQYSLGNSGGLVKL
jgi:hypothetical protein